MIEEHGGALDYDLMTRTRYKLSDLGGPLDWAALLHFTSNLDCSSALVRALRPDLAEQLLWASGERDAWLLADIFDAVAALTWTVQAANTPKGRTRPRRPRPHPRPGSKPGAGERTVGRDPVPVSAFDEWWESEKDERGQEAAHVR